MLTFNFNPPFCVDLRPYVIIKEQEDQNLSARIKRAVHLPFQLIKATFSSFFEGLCTTPKYAWPSFKYHVLGFDILDYHVLGFHGRLYSFLPPKTLPLAAFKVAIWILDITYCVFRHTIQGIGKRWGSTKTHSILEPHLKSLHPEHFQTNQKSIDVSHVPESIQVSDLLKMFDDNKPDHLGYINPGEVTKATLEIFVKNIQSREAFLGTPPRYDTPRLLAFYQQIENALRFSIHKTKQDLEKAQSQEEKRNCNENIFRFAIDMARAGSRCGGAYMGEAMDAYYRISKIKIGVEGTLETTLYEILAEKRRKIAVKQIHRHLGQDIHAYGKYMEALGPVLAIPGSENIIEHLEALHDLDNYLGFFFQEYTEDCIIKLINSQIKTSQPFREKITTWIQDQATGWNQANIDGQVLLLIEAINQVSHNEARAKETFLYKSLKIFQDLVSLCQEPLPSTDNWDEFIDELFILDSVRTTFKQKFPGLISKNLQEKLNATREKHNIKRALKEESIGKELLEYFKTAIKENNLTIDGTPLVLSACVKKVWISEAQRVSRIDPQILDRVYSRQTSLEDAVRGYTARAQRVDFLNLFQLGIEDGEIKSRMEREGISPELMEWLLVSHKIFQPQLH